MGLRVCKFRRRSNIEEQFLLTAAVQNIKRMVRLLNKDRKDTAENRIKSPFISHPLIIAFIKNLDLNDREDFQLTKCAEP